MKIPRLGCFFFSHDKYGEYFLTYEDVLYRAAEEIGIDVSVKIGQSRGAFGEIPRGYDFYVLHFSQTSNESVKSLREEQPWSTIMLLNNGGEPVPLELKGLVDANITLSDLMGRNGQHMLQRAVEKLEKSQHQRDSWEEL